jgi:predicted component of type VI protein secretion system
VSRLYLDLMPQPRIRVLAVLRRDNARSAVPLARPARPRGSACAAGAREGYAAERALPASRVHLQQLSEARVMEGMAARGAAHLVRVTIKVAVGGRVQG